MRYVFINILAGAGSTGRLITEKCRQLQREGHECLIAYGRDPKACGDIPAYLVTGRWGSRLHGLESRIFDNQGFASRRETEGLVAMLREYDPDVIWLHNLHGYYLHMEVLFSYLRTCGKEILWTLHDCWAFTGHCAYFDYVGCDRWQMECHSCPELRQYPTTWVFDGSRRNYRKKKELFTGIPKLSLVVPSRWLAQRVEKSFLREYPLTVEHHTVDTKIFHPVKSDFRQRYGLENSVILLGVANVWDRRKGLSDFCRLAELAQPNWKIVLVGLTEKQIASLPAGILGLPRTESAAKLAEIYTAADYYINPGVEETFGLTVLEAAACGTTPVVYADTACAEAAEPVQGVVTARSPESIAARIRELEESK